MLWPAACRLPVCHTLLQQTWLSFDLKLCWPGQSPTKKAAQVAKEHAQCITDIQPYVENHNWLVRLVANYMFAFGDAGLCADDGAEVDCCTVDALVSQRFEGTGDR